METGCGLFCYSICREVLQQDVDQEAGVPVRTYGRLAELGNYSQASFFAKVSEARITIKSHTMAEDCSDPKTFSDIVALGPRCL